MKGVCWNVKETCRVLGVDGVWVDSRDDRGRCNEHGGTDPWNEVRG